MVKSQKVCSGWSLTACGTASPTPELLRVPKPLTAAHYIMLGNSYPCRTVCTYLFKVKEDRVKAEKHESYSGSEPAPGLVVEGVRVEPCTDLRPALWLVVLVDGIWCSEDEGVDACHRSQSGNVADCVIEANGVDEVA